MRTGVWSDCDGRIGVNFILSMTSIFHPLSDLSDDIVYVCRDGAPTCLRQDLVFTLQYVLYFIDHIAIVFLHTKFFILAAERVFAFRRRAFYEYEKNNMAVKILGFSLSFVCLEILIKTGLYYEFDTDSPLKLRLEKGIGLWKSPAFMVWSYLEFFTSMGVGVVFFNNIPRILRHYRQKSRSLSESFEIYQTEKISKIMWPVLQSYILVGVACTPTLFICIKQAFFNDGSAYWRKAYRVGLRADYFFVAWYTLFSLTYAFYKFGIVFGKQQSQIVPVEMFDFKKVTDIHFNTLKQCWSDDGNGEDIKIFS
uniref:G protein-coupled receptor n=1 Tax=Bursaphelenchus xylophilus TaxID=6326 RepID=A0A1I7SB77_BURXY